MNGPHEILYTEGIQNLSTHEPATPGHRHAKRQICQANNGMCVRRYDEFNAAIASQANPMRLQIEPVWVAVDLDSAAGFSDGVQYFFQPASKRWPRGDQSSEGMTPDFEDRQFQRAQ